MGKAGVNSQKAGTGQEPADDVLLERFTARREQAAFEALVRRHGPLVFGVCRRVLQHEQDAEDAFQAVFCLLARKASTLRRGTTVGGWLYAVAWRVARKAKTLQARRRMRESELPDVPAPDNTPEWLWRDLWPILDEEVNRLPERYRRPFVLCHLEGKSNEEVAAELRCALGTVSSRLTRARQRLRARLTRRGMVLSAKMLAAALNPHQVLVSVRAELAQTAVRTGVRYAAGRPVAERVADLANAYLKALALTWWIKAAVLLGIAGLLSLVLLILTLGRQAQPDPKLAQRNAQRPEPLPPVQGPQQPDPELLQGTWKAARVWNGGRQLPAEGIDMIFAGDRATLRFPGMPPIAATFRVDSNKDPKEIDLVLPARVTWPGIYRLQGERLQLCIDTQGRERPANWNQERFFLYELERLPAGQR
jgi:RNA polymerase sigma-70 factor (ECF subfamily)